MKSLADDYEVPARCYYYLLDWNEQNRHAYMFLTFNKSRLCDLINSEFWQLYEFATKDDMTNFKIS